MAEKLFYGFFAYISVFIQLLKNILGYLGMNMGGGTAEFIKCNIKPAVNIIMDLKITFTKLMGTDPFLYCPGFRSSSIFIGTADIKGVISFYPAEPCKDIGGKNLYQVSQMRHIINIGQC